MIEPAQQYGTDEFDAAPEHGSRAGAHRANLGLLVTNLHWIVGAVLSVVVIVGVLLLVGGGGLDAAGDDAGAGDGSGSPSATEPAPTDATDPAATEPAPTDPATSDPADSGTEPPVTETVQPPAAPDQGVELTVLNATRTSGLAAGAAEVLEADGWTVATTDNYRDGDLPTTVFYASEELEATAAAVAAVVDGQIALDPAQTESVTVVLGTDYSP